MKILVPANWSEAVAKSVKARRLDVELVEFDARRTGPFPGAEVFFRADWAEKWPEALANAPDVRWVHTTSAGVDGLIDRTLPHGITLTESGVVYRIAIGEFVVAAMMFAARRLGELWDRCHRREWRGIQQTELYGKTCGIIGLGPIGLGVAERAKGLGMRIIGCRRSGGPIEFVTDVVPPARLDRLLEESDYVALCCPLTAETRGLLGPGQLARMKNTAWIINIARGAMIDTAALMAALREGRLGGACLDVTDPEPLPPDHPLWTCPNVFITPHTSSGNSDALNQRKVECFVDNLERYLAGVPLEGLVEEKRGY